MYKLFVATGLAAMFGVIMSAGGASATSVYTIQESYTVTACTTTCVTQPSVTITPFTSTNKAPTFNSNGGDPTPLAGQSGHVALPTGVQNFFTLDPASSAGNSTNKVSGTIQVDFTFTEYLNGVVIPGVTGTLVQDGTFQANYNGSLACSSSTGQSDCLYWNPLGVNLPNLPTVPGDGSTYGGTGDSNHQSTTASVIDLVTLSNGATLDVNFFDAQDWDITPGVSFTNIDPSPTPLPPALSLFAGGLGLFGFLGARRKKKAGAIAA
jgi:hypothetical protein